MEKINYSILIHKELTGVITPDESEMLNIWLKSDGTNSIFAENIRGIWRLSQSKVSGWEPDVEGGLHKLKQRIEEDKRNNTQKHLYFEGCSLSKGYIR